MRDCFHPDSHIRISWFRGNGADFVNGSIDMAGPRVRLTCERWLVPRQYIAGETTRTVGR
jgi:hypothetical protein